MTVILRRLPAQVRPQAGAVHIVAVNWDGGDLGQVSLKSFKIEDGAELRNQFRGNTAKVPFGLIMQ